MSQKATNAVEIEKDEQEHIWLWQWDGEHDVAICLSDEQAMKLAYRLMSYAKGQGPIEKQTISANGEIY